MHISLSLLSLLASSALGLPTHESNSDSHLQDAELNQQAPPSPVQIFPEPPAQAESVAGLQQTDRDETQTVRNETPAAAAAVAPSMETPRVHPAARRYRPGKTPGGLNDSIHVHKNKAEGKPRAGMPRRGRRPPSPPSPDTSAEWIVVQEDDTSTSSSSSSSSSSSGFAAVDSLELYRAQDVPGANASGDDDLFSGNQKQQRESGADAGDVGDLQQQSGSGWGSGVEEDAEELLSDSGSDSDVNVVYVFDLGPLVRKSSIDLFEASLAEKANSGSKGI